jgi:aspartyl-tRNA(Asn)/glutamyl-tRNA(Gln) amidotransferase subunit A
MPSQSRAAAPRPAHTATDLAFMSVAELSSHIGRRAVSPVDVVKALLDRIDRHDRALKTYITVTRDRALAEARAAEQAITRGRRRGPLHGIPISHKDISWTKDVRTTAHSKTLLDFVPLQDATHVRRLADAGMVLLGKTSTTEFASGDMIEFGMTANPWDLARYAGGSSGGSASALSAGLAVAATGSDTGGSIRCPSSFCGIVGLKPTYGRVSRFGVIALSWSQDHAGPMTRTVRDCAMLLGAMSGHDPLDPTTARVPVPDFTIGIDRGVKGLVIGVPQGHYQRGLEPDVEMAVRAAYRTFERLGARLEPVELPRSGELSEVGALLVMAEAFMVHATRLREQGHDYGPRCRRRIGGGAFYTAAEYQQALQLRRLWVEEVDAALQSVDAMVMPTLPFPAITIDHQLAGPPDTSWGTRQFNLSGHPAVSIPCGFTGAGLPVGLQVVGKAFDESMVFRVAHAYEQATNWHLRRPPLREGVVR